MESHSQYIEMLIDSCESSIVQMTNLAVRDVQTSQFLDNKRKFPFAHIIAYKDYDKQIDGDFILGFESVYDALTLSSAIGERLGIGKFDEISEDSTDLLNEFLNVVVGRTISEWDKAGLKVKFGTPSFEKNYVNKDSKHLQGYLIEMNVVQDTVDLEVENHIDKIILRVNFVEKIENKLENKTILLVDDSNVMRRIIGNILKDRGAIIKEAKDGEEAIRMHRKYNPPLTIMDINMPNMSGFDAIREIRKFSPHSRFVMLSSSSRMDEIVTAKELNVSGYLVKPVEEEKLIERVSNLF